MNKKDNFYVNALQAYIIALNEGKQDDGEYVRKLAYEFYEEDLKKNKD